MKLRRGKVKRTMARDEAALDSWSPRTDIGRQVKEKKFTSLEEIIAKGKPVLEVEIIDTLLPDLKQETLELSSTQRMTDSGRKAKYRAIVIVGDEHKYIGVGQGKADEVRPSVATAVKEAKLSVINVNLGCGSAECGCGLQHSLPIRVTGRFGGVSVTLIPAPRGTGIVANPVIRRVLQLAGIKDIWTKAEGRTKNRFHTAAAIIDAISQLNRMRISKDWS